MRLNSARLAVVKRADQECANDDSLEVRGRGINFLKSINEGDDLVDVPKPKKKQLEDPIATKWSITDDMVTAIARVLPDEQSVAFLQWRMRGLKSTRDRHRADFLPGTSQARRPYKLSEYDLKMDLVMDDLKPALARLKAKNAEVCSAAAPRFQVHCLRCPLRSRRRL